MTFESWLNEWRIDSDYEPTEKEIDAMRDAWNGAIETTTDAMKHTLTEIAKFDTRQSVCDCGVDKDMEKYGAHHLHDCTAFKKQTP